MPNNPNTLDWTSITNTNENSCTAVTCDCPTFYELHQQTAIKLLSNKVQGRDNHYRLEAGYEARARRIAAVYAKLFLENLYYGKPNLQGRFYWMGLGAFASKTMANFFNDFFIGLGYDTPFTIAKDSVDILAKGNLWLAMDIIPWHLAWAQDKASFQRCMYARDLSEFKHLKPAIDSLPWSSTVPKILVNNAEKQQQLGMTNEIHEAFNTHLDRVEEIFNDPQHRTQQARFQAAKTPLLAHLMQIAVQEQQNILQKICWDDETLKDAMRIQRSINRSQRIMMRVHPLHSIEFTPNPTLILTSNYSLSGIKIARAVPSTNTNELPEPPWSTPPEGTIIEDYDSRMEWIEDAAEKYHRLMLDDKGHDYLIRELKIIATWGDDRANPIYTHKKSNEGKQ